MQKSARHRKNLMKAVVPEGTRHNSGPARAVPFYVICCMQKARLTVARPSLFAFASGDKMLSSSCDLICAAVPE